MADVDQKPADGEEAPPPEIPIKWKKVVEEGHAGAHGGAWKIALADMMTAMMAFFLLMWLLGSTDANERQGIADYFQESNRHEPALGEAAGSNGMLSGASIIDTDGIPGPPTQTQLIELPTPRTEAGPGPDQGTSEKDNPKISKYGENISEQMKQQIAEQAKREKLDKLEQEIKENLSKNPQLSDVQNQVNVIRERDGLRVEIIDKANFSMFLSGNASMSAKAAALINEVAKSVAGMPNKLSVKGHTDSSPFLEGSERTNWSLSVERAEATRRMLEKAGMSSSRFERIEGVADTQPFNPADPNDPRNRRISITVLYNAPPAAGR
jgi:chemotaxis protein MotB